MLLPPFADAMPMPSQLLFLLFWVGEDTISVLLIRHKVDPIDEAEKMLLTLVLKINVGDVLTLLPSDEDLVSQSYPL